jgi:hypothetical protein
MYYWTLRNTKTDRRKYNKTYYFFHSCICTIFFYILMFSGTFFIFIFNNSCALRNVQGTYAFEKRAHHFSLKGLARPADERQLSYQPVRLHRLEPGLAWGT